MAEYYFDIETYTTGQKAVPEEDKIITIQYQPIRISTGQTIGDLTILKEWESSEEEIVTDFYNRFFNGKSIWDFIPVGYNLNFEWEFLIEKFEKYLGKKFTSRDIHYTRPCLDIKPIFVLLNKGNFVGCGLDKFTNKPVDGRVIKKYYENKQYSEIEQYIKIETEAFLEFLQKINSNIGKLRE